MTLTRPAAAPSADVRALLGLGIRSAAVAFDDLAGLALRDNPRRAHLIVSRILGKHIPVPAATVLDGGHRLADLVRDELAASGPAGDVEDALVIGYCETATGLGHAVAQRLGMSYLHSTREPVAGLPVAVSFEEEHSHAVAHHLQPGPSVRLAGAGPLVLVDDELTTGRTALNTIEALHARFPRPAYVVSALIDARTPAQREAFDQRAAEIGVEVRVASLAAIAVDVPDDVLERAADARAALAPGAPLPAGTPATVRVYDGRWPADQPTGARNGLTAAETARLDDAAAEAARWLGPELSGRVLVVGTEELMFLPTLLAAHLAEQPGLDVVTQSTTRSPVHAADQPGYAVRRTLEFAAPTEPGRPARLHNVVDPSAPVPDGGAWSDLRHDHVVVVVDASAEASAPLAEALRPFADVVHVVTVAGGSR